MREHIELVYIIKNKVEKEIVYFFLTDYINRNFAFNIGVPRLNLDFFNSIKYRISVFYIREHMELVYMLQNRVK